MKRIILNREFGEVRTVIVLGVGRGGTSLIAGCLRSLGVSMGVEAHPLKHEWSPVAYEENGEVNLAATHGTVREMDSNYEKWGWKSPRDVFHLESLLPLLRDPGFIFVTRDLLEASLSGLTYQDVPLNISFDETALAYRAITRRLRYWPWPSLSVPFAEALRNPEEFVELLSSFVNMEPTAEARDQAVRFVQPGPDAYRPFDAKPGDSPVLTSPEDIRADSEGLAADYSKRYGAEYWREFEKVLKEARALGSRLSSEKVEEAISIKLMRLLEALPPDISSHPGEQGVFSRIKRAMGASGWSINSVLKQLSISAEEAKERLAKRVPGSGYADLMRFFRVLQVTIRVRHALQAALLGKALGQADKVSKLNG